MHWVYSVLCHQQGWSPCRQILCKILRVEVAGQPAQHFSDPALSYGCGPHWHHVSSWERLFYIDSLILCVPFCNILYLVSYTSWPPSIYGPTCYIQTAHLSLSLALSNAVPCHFSWPSRYCLVPWRLSASRADFWAPLVRFLTGYQDFFPALRSIGLTYTHILRHVTVHAPCTNTKAVSWQNSAKSFPNTKHLSADEPLQGLAIPTTDVHIWNWDEAAAFTWQNTKATHGTLQWLHGMTHVSRTVVSPANTM